MAPARLYATDVIDETMALIIERCVPGTTLTASPAQEQDTVIAGLLRRLWREPVAGHPFRSLQFMCDIWADGYERKAAAGAAKLDSGLAREGIELFRTLPSNAPRDVLLVTDLHAGNVLRAEREPWLVIDPKPFVGDPTYDALQHLLNSDNRLHADPIGLVSRMAGSSRPRRRSAPAVVVRPLRGGVARLARSRRRRPTGGPFMSSSADR